MNEELTPDAVPAEAPVISDLQAQMALDNLRAEQNLPMGAIAGLVAAVLGAGVWAVVTVVTEYQIGWLAVGIGLLVGFAVRFSGKGIDRGFGIVGAALSLIGCALGNVFTVSYFIALNEGMAFLDVLGQLNIDIIVELLTATFQAMDILFYALAVYFGYKYAFRQVTEEDFNRALGKAI